MAHNVILSLFHFFSFYWAADIMENPKIKVFIEFLVQTLKQIKTLSLFNNLRISLIVDGDLRGFDIMHNLEA